MSQKEKEWRSEIVEMKLRINGHTYPEVFNRLCTCQFNVILYLIKYCKMEPETAARLVANEEYTLLVRGKDDKLQQVGNLNLRGFWQHEVFYLVRKKKKPDEQKEDSRTEKMKEVSGCYTMNPYGGFRIEWLNRYIIDYIVLPKGESESLVESASWMMVKSLSETIYKEYPELVEHLA